MKGKPSVLCIIPAKGTSTRIPGKNLKDLCGKPMLAYILETAKAAVGIDRVVVTTDSEEVKGRRTIRCGGAVHPPERVDRGRCDVQSGPAAHTRLVSGT